jgi:Zn-finger nucleic acid-binding protein
MGPIRRPLDPRTGAPVTIMDVVEYFAQCPKCGGWMDKRDRDAVLRHEQEAEQATAGSAPFADHLAGRHQVAESDCDTSQASIVAVGTAQSGARRVYSLSRE